jgi:hypothetical protein
MKTKAMYKCTYCNVGLKDVMEVEWEQVYRGSDVLPYEPSEHLPFHCCGRRMEEVEAWQCECGEWVEVDEQCNCEKGE